MAAPNAQQFAKLTSAVSSLVEALDKNTTSRPGGETDELTDKFKTLGKELVSVGEAGRKLAQSLGTSFVGGVELELKNRASAVKQILTLDANRAASLSQIISVERSLADTFISVRDGLQSSSEGAATFASNLKGGFRSEFELTGESLRALTIIGGTTSEEFNRFRIATGRASLSSGQLSNIVNKNALSFLIYGNSFAKAAADAEKIGVSLASIQSAQAGLVTNLDSTIDTVAQLNQLGAQVDFGTLVRIAEQEGPDALLSYLRATVPDNFFRSTSFRALFEQLGVSSEQLLRAGKVKNNADVLDASLSEVATTSSTSANALALLTSSTSALKLSFAGLSLSIAALATRMAATAIGGVAGLAGTAAKLTSPLGIGLTAVGAGLGLYNMFKGDDVVSTYGERALVTPTGAIALNNNDTVLAGTKLMGAGTLQAGSDTSVIAKKVDDLIKTLESATTTINIDGTQKTVPRMSLVGVYSRNERA
jgi:hypothetical protein